MPVPSQGSESAYVGLRAHNTPHGQPNTTLICSRTNRLRSRRLANWQLAFCEVFIP
jgi:hypothetical protein